MRIADKMAYGQVTANLQKNRSEMSELQNQASTQKRINKLSDDPVAAARVLGLRSESGANKQFVKNIDMAKSFLEFSEQSLGEISESLMRAKELAVQMANDPGASAESRRVAAGEIEQIYNQVVQIGNRKLGERYVFAGHKTHIMPFNAEGEYSGDEGDMKIQINKDAFISMNISGEKVLLGKNLTPEGMIKTKSNVPKNTEELRELKREEKAAVKELEELEQGAIPLRVPASVNPKAEQAHSVAGSAASGVNVLQTLKDFAIGLKTNDKQSIQEALDGVDQALSQVISARSQIGSRVSLLNATSDSLRKSINENKASASQLEDVDLFQVVSDINKTDSTLRASLETSTKVMNSSLLDFLK